MNKMAATACSSWVSYSTVTWCRGWCMSGVEWCCWCGGMAGINRCGA